ncbi:MAG: thiamine diphosphokinase [Ignavibacteria bacterium]|nr:thiamine diphosphokinase [Ignavibacteria bacterium]
MKSAKESSKHSIIICNGSLKKSELLKVIRKFPDAKLICCDGASNRLKRWNIVPHLITGDMDGSTEETLKFFKKKKVKIKKIYDQNRNDLEKALETALSGNSLTVVVTGFAGKRLDHTYGNLSILARYSSRLKLILYDSSFRGEFIRGESTFRCKYQSTVSLIPLPNCHIIETNGLKWRLKNETLSFTFKEGTLNKSTGRVFTIKIKSGSMLVLFKEP